MMEMGKLAAIVGDGNLIEESSILAHFAQDHSFVARRQPRCAVRPGGLEQVRKIVALAVESGTPLIPVSSGGPRFRGDTVPAFGGVMVDMSGMNGIRMIDRKDRVAMIEPGVRFGELQEALRREGLRLPMPLCPRATKSVVGSCLEREPHIMPRYHLDHSDPLLCNEVVFGTGDVFRTGEAGGPGTIEEQRAAGRRQKIAMGLQMNLNRILQGSQGTLGIVTWSTVKCEVLPLIQRPFLAASEDLARLLELSYWLVRRRLGDEILLLDKTNLALLMGGSERAHLSEALPSYTLLFCLSGLEYLPEQRVEQQEEDVGEIAASLGIPTCETLCGVSAKDVLERVGNPCSESYWKLEAGGGCQDLPFICSLQRIPHLVDVMSAEAARHGLSPLDLGIYIQPVCQGHGHHVEFSLFHEAGDSAVVERMKRLYRSAAKALMEGGAFFSRPYDLLADMVHNRDAASREALRKLKHIFDPGNVMNPGKLCF